MNIEATPAGFSVPQFILVGMHSTRSVRFDPRRDFQPSHVVTLAVQLHVSASHHYSRASVVRHTTGWTANELITVPPLATLDSIRSRGVYCGSRYFGQAEYPCLTVQPHSSTLAYSSKEAASKVTRLPYLLKIRMILENCTI